MHRTALLGHLPAFIDGIRAEREEIEADLRVRISAVVSGGDRSACQQVVAKCWKDAMELEDRWFERMGRADGFHETGYDDAWRSMSEIAGLEISQDP